MHAIRVDQIAGREAEEATGLVFPPESVPSRRVTPARLDAATEAFRRGGRIVIVAASLAGLRAAATLRLEGFTGSLTIIGDEPYHPYDRPPLSKQVLEGDIPAEHTGLPASDRLNARWLLGVPATGLDLAGKQVRLADGGMVEYDRLLIATGRGPGPGSTKPRPHSTACSCCVPATTPPAWTGA